MFFEAQPFIAVIGDMIASRNLQARRVIQEELASVLYGINASYRKDIASRFMITLGDEFQALLHTGTHVMEIIEKIEDALHPVKLRFGIGVGEMTTEIDPNFPLGADGPAYYGARKRIEEIKRLETKNRKSKQNIMIEIERNAEITDLMNTVFSLNTAVKAKWTERQREIINVYTSCGETQEETARRLGIRPSTVQRSLASAHFYAYRQALDTVTNILSTIREKQDG